MAILLVPIIVYWIVVQSKMIIAAVVVSLMCSSTFILFPTQF